MGYRSDVGIVLTKNAHRKMMATIKGNPNKKVAKEITDTLEHAYKGTDKKTGQVFYLFESIKWYDGSYGLDGYEDIVFINTFIKKNLKPKEYYMVIIGEELEDNQLYGEMWENAFEMGFARTITHIEIVPETVEQDLTLVRPKDC